VKTHIRRRASLVWHLQAHLHICIFFTSYYKVTVQATSTYQLANQLKLNHDEVLQQHNHSIRHHAKIFRIIHSQSPPKTSPSPIYQDFTDTFDDLTDNPVSALQTVGIYYGLDYSQFNLAAHNALSGAIPPSLPNSAAFELENSLTSGQVSLNPVATLKRASGTKHFDLIQFYFACLTTNCQSLVDVPAGCGISVTGYNIAGQMVAEASFNYAPTLIENAPYAKAALPASFIGLQNITFGIADASVAVSLTVMAIDNVSHINYV
jgi:hypothetical protein